MTQQEAIELQSKAITRLREIQLCRLREANAILRAHLALARFYQQKENHERSRIQHRDGEAHRARF